MTSNSFIAIGNPILPIVLQNWSVEKKFPLYRNKYCVFFLHPALRRIWFTLLKTGDVVRLASQTNSVLTLYAPDDFFLQKMICMSHVTSLKRFSIRAKWDNSTHMHRICRDVKWCRKRTQYL